MPKSQHRKKKRGNAASGADFRPMKQRIKDVSDILDTDREGILSRTKYIAPLAAIESEVKTYDNR